MKSTKKFVKSKLDKKKFLKSYKKSSNDVSTRDGKDKNLATKIYTHNKKQLHSFVDKMKKSIDFKDTLVSVNTEDQLLAETTVNKELLNYIQKNISNAAADNPQASQWKMPFPTGVLTLTQREPGLYHGFFQDKDGQVVEKFDSQTIAIIAKTLQLKSLVPDVSDVSEVSVPNASEIALSAHSRINELQRQVLEQVKGRSIKIKMGDFELEIRKSLSEFITDFKASKTADKSIIRKAISSWRKKNEPYMTLQSDQAAAKELSHNWDTHQESFCQFVDAMSRREDE